MEPTAHEVSQGVTIFFSIILLLMILSLALEEKIHAQKSVIVSVFAIICLGIATAWGLLPFGDITLPNGHHVSIPVYIPAVDWGVIAIILGSSIFVDVTSRTGLFSWVAIKLTKASGGDSLKLLWSYGLLTVLFSALLNNVTAMIIIGSLTAVSLNRLNQSDKLLGFLLIEGLLTNIGGLMTLISSVPNIIVGNAAKITFIEFFITASPYVLVATFLTIFMGAKFFSIKALIDEDDILASAELIETFDENDGIESQGFFWFGAGMLVLFILTIATTSILPVARELGMGFVALSFAVIMLLRYKSSVDQFYRSIDWDLLTFFITLFVVINVMEHAKVLELIGKGISLVISSEESLFDTGALLVLSAAFSSVTDNIPLAAMLAKILGAGGTTSDSALWWSVVFGANLGGNLTPIGSASTLVAVTIMHKNHIKMSFVAFVKVAIPFALIQILLALGYVLVFLY
jgi:Na+/H+ antiporter NhaD/arsenite permease-like protein